MAVTLFGEEREHERELGAIDVPHRRDVEEDGAVVGGERVLAGEVRGLQEAVVEPAVVKTVRCRRSLRALRCDRGGRPTAGPPARRGRRTRGGCRRRGWPRPARCCATRTRCGPRPRGRRRRTAARTGDRGRDRRGPGGGRTRTPVGRRPATGERRRRRPTRGGSAPAGRRRRAAPCRARAGDLELGHGDVAGAVVVHQADRREVERDVVAGAAVRERVPVEGSARRQVSSHCTSVSASGRRTSRDGPARRPGCSGGARRPGPRGAGCSRRRCGRCRSGGSG